MIAWLVFLADAKPASTTGAWRNWVVTDGGYWLILAALLLVTAGVFIWATFIRKRRRPSYYQLRHHTPSSEATGASGRKKFRWLFFSRRHRRHRNHRRNPTLPESGGLPSGRANKPPATSN